MKIAVIGDVHLGASMTMGYKDHRTGRNSRLLDYEHTLEKTLSLVAEQGCTVVVFTGDIFEHRHPNALYQKIFSKQLRNALNFGIKEIHIVVGNHDQQRQANATTISYLQELGLENIVVHDKIDSTTVVSSNGIVAANLIFLPYRDRKWLEAETYKEAIDIIDRDIKYELSSLSNDAPRFLIGHMAIEGTFFAKEDEELYSDNELFLPIDMFKNIDATIMGHVHSHNILSSDPYVAYVGSMEKRGAFEKHNKKYAIIDTNTKKITYGDEPCRDIYDIVLDLSHQPYGKDLDKKVLEKVAKFAETNSLESSIVRVILSIASDDASFVDAKKIESTLYKKYGVEFCAPIKPRLYFSRQARDSNITEHSSDTEAFTRYVKNTVDDEGSAKKLIAKGLEIIKLESAEDDS